MEKSDGAYDIALWWDPWIWDKATNTELTFAPLSGTTPIATYHGVRAVTLALGAGSLIVEIEPASPTPTGGKVFTLGSAGGVVSSTGPTTRM